MQPKPLRQYVEECVECAKASLQQDGALLPVVLMTGPESAFEILLKPNMPTTAVNAVLRGLVETNPDLDVAVYISVAHVLFAPRGEIPPRAADIHSNPNSKLCIVVHGTHRTDGMIAAHVEFEAPPEQPFRFGEIKWPDGAVMFDPVLDALWAPVRLNS
jgi:hypothetical protein